MTITLEPPPDLEEIIAREAARYGLTVNEYVLRAVVREAAPNHLDKLPLASTPTVKAGPSVDVSTLALFAQWAAEDATDDPEELERRQRDGDAFMASLQANRMNIPSDPELLAVLETDDQPVPPNQSNT